VGEGGKGLEINNERGSKGVHGGRKGGSDRIQDETGEGGSGEVDSKKKCRQDKNCLTVTCRNQFELTRKTK
jgi:hypothetical protein